MYKVLLVDDEQQTREGIAAMVNWAECGFELCGQASGGIEAIELAGRSSPDVVLTDIRMPFMSGLEMITRLQEMHPAIQYIVFSGHDDFSYVKQALQRQVLDYLLKPLSAEMISLAMVRARQALDEKARQRTSLDYLRKAARESENKRVQIALAECLNGYQFSAGSLLSSSHHEQTDLHLPVFIASLLIERSQDNLDILQARYDNNPSLLRIAVGNIMNDFLLTLPYPVPSLLHRDAYVLFLPPPQEAAYKICLDLIQLLQDYIGISGDIGLAGPAAQMADISDCYQSSLVALDRRHIHPQHNVYVSENRSGTAAAFAADQQLAQQLLSHVRTGCGEPVDDLLQAIRVDVIHRSQTVAQRQIIMAGLFAQMIHTATQLGLDLPSDLLATSDSSLLDADIDDNFSHLRRLALAICRHVQDQNETTVNNDMVHDMIRYIETHHTDPELSLDHLCSAFHASQTHVSMLFRKYAGTTFLQSLLDVRIRQAKTLLQDTDLKIYQIAEQTGFSDASYFSYCFRQRCGITPREFRAAL